MRKRISIIIAAGIWLFVASAGLFLSLPARAQEPEVRPVLLGEEMPDFTLPAFQGGDVTLSKLKGKNVMIVFPRGFAAEGRWCTICNYKYGELLDLEKTEHLLEKYNLEILYVFPYGKDIVKQWVDVLPEQMDKIKTWKNPSEPDKLDEKGRNWTERARKGFPKDISFEKGNVSVPFPLLIDADRKLTKGLGLFTTDWSGSKAEQLIPSYFVLDKQGIVQFKYIGQNTWDRPSWEYMEKVLEIVNSGK
ncbi:MAG TPA: redoxin domain-containing protein [Candidatus Desulfaltia sp.]|nr:redoxin domain-containing protein [Candidatus Desulfaltia sp.]